jgi:hypothetical protein
MSNDTFLWVILAVVVVVSLALILNRTLRITRDSTGISIETQAAERIDPGRDAGRGAEVTVAEDLKMDGSMGRDIVGLRANSAGSPSGARVANRASLNDSVVRDIIGVDQTAGDEHSRE